MLEEMMTDLTDVFAGGVTLALIITVLAIIFLVFTIGYVYYSFVLMALAKKTKTENAWMAWIPFANIFLLTNISGLEWWYALLILFGPAIPIVGILASLIASIYVWWKIAINVDKPGWMGILANIFPVAPIFAGILAWSKMDNQDTFKNKTKKNRKTNKNKK